MFQRVFHLSSSLCRITVLGNQAHYWAPLPLEKWFCPNLAVTTGVLIPMAPPPPPPPPPPPVRGKKAGWNAARRGRLSA
eukprot:1302951-Amphidinium_carterae.1